MIKITNGVDIFEVTRGAFDGIYSRQGYRVLNDILVDAATEVIKEDEVNEDDCFVKELEEKPIGQWNKEEVKRFAALKDIDITGTKNANEAKERIKVFLADEQ